MHQRVIGMLLLGLLVACSPAVTLPGTPGPSPSTPDNSSSAGPSPNPTSTVVGSPSDEPARATVTITGTVYSQPDCAERTPVTGGVSVKATIMRDRQFPLHFANRATPRGDAPAAYYEYDKFQADAACQAGQTCEIRQIPIAKDGSYVLAGIPVGSSVHLMLDDETDKKYAYPNGGYRGETLFYITGKGYPAVFGGNDFELFTISLDPCAPTVHGIVFDDQGNRLTGVTITGKATGRILFANGSDTLTATTWVGSYALNGAPWDKPIIITASKTGYSSRQQTIMPKVNMQGDPAANKLDFGDNVPGSDTYSLSAISDASASASP